MEAFFFPMNCYPQKFTYDSTHRVIMYDSTRRVIVYDSTHRVITDTHACITQSWIQLKFEK